MYYALINELNNIVESIIVLNEEDFNTWPTPIGYQLIISDIASIGDLYDGITFIKQTPIELPPITKEELQKQIQELINKLALIN